MKVNAAALGNLAFKAMYSNEDDIGRAGYANPRVDDGQVMACDEVVIAASLTRALAERKKRIVIEVTYPKT